MNSDNSEPRVVWGYSIVEPERGHVRETGSSVVDGAVVGFAICGALLVGDLPDQAGEFPQCSACLTLLEQNYDDESDRL